MEKQVIVSKHLHSSLSSFSSNDEWVEFSFPIEELDFGVVSGNIINSKHKVLCDEVISCFVENQYYLKIYLEADKTYYLVEKAFRDSATKEQMKALVQKYIDKGWKHERDDKVSEEINKERERLENRLRILNGHIYGKWSEKTDIHQGGLSKELFNDEYLQEYLTNDGCYGYIGAFERSFGSDRIVEFILKENDWTNREIAIFMCSRDGRHFADGLDTMEEVAKDSVEKISKCLSYVINSFINQAWVKEEVNKVVPKAM